MEGFLLPSQLLISQVFRMDPAAQVCVVAHSSSVRRVYPTWPHAYRRLLKCSVKTLLRGGSIRSWCPNGRRVVVGNYRDHPV